jgi:hypothetical protein
VTPVDRQPVNRQDGLAGHLRRRVVYMRDNTANDIVAGLCAEVIAYVDDSTARVRDLEAALREAEEENAELRAYRDRMKRGNHGKRGWPDFLVRVWSKVDMAGPDDCWPWNAYVNPEGYGQMTLRDGNKYYSHRIVYELGHREEIPPGLIVRHTCDQPSCHNPAHLILGTHADNNRDTIERGRHRNGHTGPMLAEER